MNNIAKNSLSTEIANLEQAKKIYEQPGYLEYLNDQNKELYAEYTEVKSIKSRIIDVCKSILKWLFIYLITLFFGGMLSLKLCHIVADAFNWNYISVWINLFCLIIFCISFTLYRVNEDSYSRTCYENDFTPMNAIFLIIRLFILCIIFLFSASAIDGTNEIERRLKNETFAILTKQNTTTPSYKEISTPQENSIPTIKETTEDDKQENPNIASDDNNTNELYYRD